MRGLVSSRARTALVGLGLVFLSGVGVAQTRHEGTPRRQVLHRRADTPEGRAREHWAETWELASAKRGSHSKVAVHRARHLRVAKLCRAGQGGRERCATVREVAWQR